MILLTLQNVVRDFSGESLFEPLSFDVRDNDRIALIGANGTGKSTIIKMIINQLETSKGSVIVSRNVKLGYLSQDVIQSTENSLYEECLAVFSDLILKEKELMEIATKMTLYPDDASIYELYGKKEAMFSALNGYEYHYQIEMILRKFGFTEEEFQRKIVTFSGGERTKMAFAKLLLIKPDILILDEPTNHLDIETIEWLETYLKSYSGAIVFVSHDRYFINAIANRVIEIENKHFIEYPGDYDHFLLLKSEAYERRMKEFNVQQREIAKLKRFIEYFMPKPRFVSRAKDRVNKLARIDVLEKPTVYNKTIKFVFGGMIYQGKRIIEINDLAVGFDEDLLVTNFSSFIEGGDRIALMGNNGTGKTTLLKAIIENQNIISGYVKKLLPIKIGYIRQNDFDFPNVSLFAYFSKLYPKMLSQEIYDHLARFGFDYEDKDKSCLVLSGGEKMRLILAKIVLEDYQLLILDEPTNHLDMLTREQLINALNKYEGSILFVTHDRYFADEIANRIFFIHKKKVLSYLGRYSEFKEDVLDKLEESEGAVKVEKAKEKKENLKQSSMSQVKIDKMMQKLEEQIKEITEEEFKEENYMDTAKMKVLKEKHDELVCEYEKLFELLE